jgi:hypothetical protein
MQLFVAADRQEKPNEPVDGARPAVSDQRADRLEKQQKARKMKNGALAAASKWARFTLQLIIAAALASAVIVGTVAGTGAATA